DHAILQRDGIIAAIGPFANLHAQHPDLPVTGSGNEVVLPGFVNAHHHVGLTPVQLGSPDMPLELWFATRMVLHDVDLYPDTLYSAFEMLASGITTVQHIQGWASGALPDVEVKADNVIRAYQDIGMRVSYCYALRDQNHLVYEDNAAFTARVSEDLRPALSRHFARFRLTADDLVALFESLHARHHNKDRVRIQLAPANLHWCSDHALRLLADTATKHDALLHMHLVETPYQKEYARRRGNCTALEYIDRFGLLGPRLTLGHGVWLNESDIDRVAETGTCICHNCSSNFRLRSGMAPLNRWEARGITVAIGLDEAGINDDRDMLQEMRMVLRAHREPGMDDRVPAMAQVFRMATENGARTTPFAPRIGSLEVGQAADMVLIDWNQVAYPYLDVETPVLDAVLQRAKVEGVRAVLVAGEPVYQDGRFVRVDRDAALREIAAMVGRPFSAEEQERRWLAKAILPHVRAFYDGWWKDADHEPFYRPSARV